MFEKFNREQIQKLPLYVSRHHSGEKIFNLDGLSLPVMTYLFGTALNVINYADYETMITFVLALVLLHNIENTDFAYKDLRNDFGRHIIDAILAFTKDQSFPYEEELANSIMRIKINIGRRYSD